MKAQNDFTILTKEKKENKSKIVLSNEALEDCFTVFDSEEYKKGIKVVCFDYPQIGYVDGDVTYFVTKTRNICALV